MLPESFFGKTACCFTGHRPDGLPDGGDERAESVVALKQTLLAAVHAAAAYGVTTFLTGGALGFDTLAAEAVLAWKPYCPALRLVLALPSKTQPDRWPEAARSRYYTILSAADDVFYAAEAGNHHWAMLRRNRYLVDHADCCIAYLAHASGGTLYTVNYAMDRGIPVFNLYGAEKRAEQPESI